jgi:hypothetical protein
MPVMGWFTAPAFGSQVWVRCPRLSWISRAMRYWPWIRFVSDQFAVTVVSTGTVASPMLTHELPLSSARPLPLVSYQYLNCAVTSWLMLWQLLTVSALMICAFTGTEQLVGAPAVIDVEMGWGMMPRFRVRASPKGPGEVASHTNEPSHTMSFWNGFWRLLAVANRNWNGVFGPKAKPPCVVEFNIATGIW